MWKISSVLKTLSWLCCIPNSRKLSGEKTFANFEILWLFVKAYSTNCGACVPSFHGTSEQFFSAKILFSTNLWKFSPTKVSRCTAVSVSNVDCSKHGCRQFFFSLGVQLSLHIISSWVLCAVYTSYRNAKNLGVLRHPLVYGLDKPVNLNYITQVTQSLLLTQHMQPGLVS